MQRTSSSTVLPADSNIILLFSRLNRLSSIRVTDAFGKEYYKIVLVIDKYTIIWVACFLYKHELHFYYRINLNKTSLFKEN